MMLEKHTGSKWVDSLPTHPPPFASFLTTSTNLLSGLLGQSSLSWRCSNCPAWENIYHVLTLWTFHSWFSPSWFLLNLLHLHISQRSQQVVHVQHFTLPISQVIFWWNLTFAIYANEPHTSHTQTGWQKPPWFLESTHLRCDLHYY